MSRARSGFWLAAATALAMALLAGCNGSDRSADCPCASSALPPPVDSSLMAYLSKARAIHHEADLLEQEGRIADAAKKLEELIASAAPGGGVMPEVQEVLSDTYARVADLTSRQGRFDEAERAIREGLGRAPAASYFEGHLFEVRGLNEQRRAEHLAKDGQADASRAAREAAMRAFERAVEVQDSVVDRALGNDGGAAP